jgi:hypothetical protein
LFDGLDEVPTDQGRAAVSRMLEDCVARFPANRYVVTSRVRAYTGDTILKAEFTRCDVQPFDAADRAEFIRNWVALLFRVPRETVATGGGEPQREFQGLCRGIDQSERIRVLAVNPLLLTVISIVHWNRKRLPEQRVELYDECVDVLLGQRKEAEHVQLARKAESLDLQHEQDQYEERSWVRKRFAEIALYIQFLEGDRDEATRADLVELLKPRFIDRGAASDEQAASQAELFLERQELQSGLLVGRRAQTYRFVHLTFQEYLAAWHLSNQEFDAVTQSIQPRLRRPKWFETLQLLGGEWAKQSDAKLDRFLGWLLEQQGEKVADRAPVVALCSNLVKDTSGVAELRLETRQAFRSAVKATLDAFRLGSLVPVATQLEILEALAQLGAAVKSHLIDATMAGLFPVRRRAIQMLLPHLSDDELFALQDILEDRSKEPIKSYLQSLLDRDPARFEAWILTLPRFGEKAAQAILEMPSFPQAFAGRVRQLAIEDDDYDMRRRALWLLAWKWPDETTPELLAARAVEDSDEFVRWQALDLLAGKWPDETTRQLLAAQAVEDSHQFVRGQALDLLAGKWPDETTRGLLAARAVEDSDEFVRWQALDLLAGKWPDETTRQLLAARAADGNLPLYNRLKHTLVLAGMHSKFGRLLLASLVRPLGGVCSYSDALASIPREHIARAAERAGIKPDQIDAQVASLSEFLGWDITRGAKAGKLPSRDAP